MSKRETSSEIDDAAAHWAMRIDEAVLDDAEQAAFDTWLRADVRRIGAFARAQAVLVHVKRAKALGSDFEPATFAPEREKGGAADVGDDADDVAEEEPSAPTILTRRRLLVGASALAASAVAAIVLPTRQAAARIYETARGESRLVPLEDGSTVTLNTDTRIAVTMGGDRRAVELLRGEVLFKVAGAGRPPFQVEAGGASLQTEKATFAVCRLDARPLQVKVCDGTVAVERPSTKPRLLHANTQALLPDDGTMIERSVTPEALQRELAWQEGMLSFEDTPLTQAAEEFARYSDRRIQISDPAVAAETVTGRYAANNPEGFARAVALGLNLHVQSTPGGIIVAR
ncbi:MAG: FecR domain-containing protein [Sphingomonadales bacterium]|nr:FecR domain-containing protein [Sphingomonadales bacterium]